MAPQVLLAWILLFAAFVFLQALFINGVRTSMAGHTEKMPNGRDKDSEEIFYPFFKFITQSYIKKVYYEGAQFAELKDILYGRFRQIMPFASNKDMQASYLIFNTDEEITQLKGVAVILKNELGILTDIDGRHVRFYKEYEEYRFNKYLRKPFGQCIKCMASVYGVVTYWPVVLTVYGFQLWQVPVFIADVFLLVHVNYLLYKK